MTTESDSHPQDLETSPQAESPATASLSVVQQLFRFLLVLTFLLAAQLLTASAMSFAMYGYTRAILYLLFAIGLFVASATLINRQIAKVFGPGQPRYLALITPTAAACAAIVLYLIYESNPRELWLGLAYLSVLVTVVAGLRVVARAKEFSWTSLVVVLMAIFSGLFVFEHRPVTAAQATARVSARKPNFQSLLEDLKKLDETIDFEAALNDATEEAKYYGKIPAIDSNLLVVGFHEWVLDAELVHSPSYIEGYLPPDLLAAAPSDVQVVAVVEAVHPTHTGTESPLVIDVLLYSWPDATHLASAKLPISRKAKHTGFQVFPAAAAALRTFLKVAPNESAAFVTKPDVMEESGSQVEITNSIGIKLKLIPAGEFQMGSAKSPQEIIQMFGFRKIAADLLVDEHPQHKVRITKPFYLGVYEVTVGQFRQFVEATGYKTDAEKDGDFGGFGWNESEGKWEGPGWNESEGKWGGPDPKYTWRNTGFAQTDAHPVVMLSWNDAVAFCEWLSRKEGETYRLPTEAEWEYACRAGTTTLYSHGDDPEGLAQVGNVGDATANRKLGGSIVGGCIKADDGYVFTAPVGRFRANPFGLYDMHGNVWECCQDYYDDNYYARSPTDDPTGPERGPNCSCSHVLRGSSFSGDFPDYFRCASRHQIVGLRFANQGFRVARTLTP